MGGEHTVTVGEESGCDLCAWSCDFNVRSVDDRLTGITLRINRGDGQGLGVSRGEADRCVLRTRVCILFDVSSRGDHQRSLGVRVLGGCAQGDIVRGQGLRDNDHANSLIGSPTNTVGCSRSCRSLAGALGVVTRVDVDAHGDDRGLRGKTDDART